jgi:hypothetical protein
METVFVSFSDETETVINGGIGGPQPMESVPYQGEVAVNDPRYVAWFDSLPEWSQIYLPEPVRTS